MNQQKQPTLGVDAEELIDWLSNVGYSFNINLNLEEMNELGTFGQLSDFITGKITLDQVESCTTQQAFYKLRRVANNHLAFPNLLPSTPLYKVLPLSKRKRLVRQLETGLGHETDLLEPPIYLSVPFSLLLLASPFSFFFGWQIGLLCSLGALISSLLTALFCVNLTINTAGELAEKIAAEHYVKTRRNPTTVNKSEIFDLLQSWASRYFGIDKKLLTRDLSF